MNSPADLPSMSRHWLRFGPQTQHAFAIVAIVATAFIFNRWLLDARAYFFADDWQWLWRAEFFPWSDSFYSVLPSWAYNDRPVGAAFIKAIYDLVGLNHGAFQFAWLALHALNCALLYALATRYIGRIGAFAAALLAAIWFSANDAVGWVAAIFDVLGATLCLAIILFRQLSRQSGYALAYDLAGASCYVLAIRTKEFALGMIVVLFLMSMLVERQSLRATFRQLWPYLAVFLVFAARYVQLLATTLPPSGTPYHMEMSLQVLLTSLGFYVSVLFYGPFGVPAVIVGGLAATMGVAMLRAEETRQRAALWGILTFVILLGPVLMLPAQQHSIYLYAPHFFLALAIGALIARHALSLALVGVIVVGVVVPPFATQSRHDVINFHLNGGEKNQAMLISADSLLTQIPRGATVFISGVKPVLNPFWIQPGNALKTTLKDFTLNVESERPEPELAARFCDTRGYRRFLRFEGTRASDVTAEIAGHCDAPTRPESPLRPP